VWSEQPFDRRLQDSLAQLPEPAKTNLHSDYLAARRYVIDEIVGHIPASEPDLTDHSEAHLADVMKQVCALLGPPNDSLSPHELYLLGVSILFHDVGNLHGRSEHHKKIADIYNAARKGEARFHTERNAVLAIAGAHTGSTKTGNKDTVKNVTTLSFDGSRVKGQELAALLRFGDELAEGPHRTSAYLLNHHGYKPESVIFHKYAASVEYFIDRHEGRIALTYTFDLELVEDVLEVGNGVKLDDMLKFCYARLVKLDQERKYCKYYSSLLSVFKETSACFIFYYRGHKLDFDIEPIVISDIVLPGDHTKQIEERYPLYEISSLICSLTGLCEESK
jgi:hypothetical protein